MWLSHATRGRNETNEEWVRNGRPPLSTPVRPIASKGNDSVVLVDQSPLQLLLFCCSLISETHSWRADQPDDRIHPFIPCVRFFSRIHHKPSIFKAITCLDILPSPKDRHLIFSITCLRIHYLRVQQEKRGKYVYWQKRRDTCMYLHSFRCVDSLLFRFIRVRKEIEKGQHQS